MIDLHSHVLPGLDDGAADLEQALAICDAAAADGIEVLAATPHVRHDYPTTPGQMEAALAEVRAGAGDRIRVVAGGELDLDELRRPVEELARFGLGGTRTLLVETPYVGWPLDLAERLFAVRVAGFSTVLAHPERNREVQQRPELLAPIVAAGTLVQLTAASVDGRFGRSAKACSFRLLERGLAHLVASDAHAPELRAVGLSGAVEAIGDPELARWLTEDVPRAILDGGQTPPRPVRDRPRRLGFLRRS
ncbi:MAG TPA: CpsB/CapC family capsule biosynthesis tyrosine phosphatase [Gaiellaceae bacterium]|nr:CpsB/CapC family capsule biosynthesis tyrosine phosphatase [Gaiellaceae bacterium]